MWESLGAFYSSDQWKSFRRKIIQERSDAAGLIKSELSGKVLAKQYDIIVHHITELTIKNVNDYSISLNPENVMIVSFQEHNEIHKRFGFSGYKKVYLVEGAPCSGKSSFVEKSKGNSDLVVDYDLIWQAVTGGEKYRKPEALKKIVFQIHETLIDAVKTRHGNWEKAFVITADPYESARQRLAEKLGAERVEVSATREECLTRLQQNPNGRDIALWTALINKYFDAE